MLIIRNDRINNHFSDNFVPLCHVDYFINGDRRKLTVICICHFLHFPKLNFIFSSLRDALIS